jgi:hypothetical protein
MEGVYVAVLMATSALVSLVVLWSVVAWLVRR